MYNDLATYVEEISDDFQSTFTPMGPNELVNMISPSDFDNLTKIVQKYIPDAKLLFVKTGYFNDDYDIYTIKMV